LSTSLAHRPSKKAVTMPSMQRHRVALTMNVTQNVSLFLESSI